MTDVDGLLFNPRTYDPQYFDEPTRRLLRATIDFFEGQGKHKLVTEEMGAGWPTEFVDFVKREKLFATFLTPAAYGGDDPAKRWDGARNHALSEILGFYGMAYWYTEQVTILGLGPIWQSANEKAKLRAAADLDDGQVMAFGLSERAHGADVYQTDMILTPADEADQARGIRYRANGTKYYIGNGNVASMVSVFGKFGEGAELGEEAGANYAFFVADSRRPEYELIDNVVHMQLYVSTFALHNYPVRDEDILHTGVEAFAAALNTVNVGKFNLCSGAIGMSEHSFYEAITHADNRILYGNRVTDFSHVRANFVEAYARILAMKLFSQRSVDYFRSASLEDRRYLLFNPLTKSKVTMEGERVINLLHDVIAAKGYEKYTMFRHFANIIGAYPRLEGTVHVNVGLVLKFMPNYMLNPAEYPEIGTRLDAVDDKFFFAQGPTRGAGRVQFADWKPAFERFSRIDNVATFYGQARKFADFLMTAGPDAEQQKDLDFLLTVGQIFSLIAYGQLILEQAELTGLDDDAVAQIFDTIIRDFSSFAVDLLGKPTATQPQQDWARDAIAAPTPDPARFDRMWSRVQAYNGAYEMNP
ncbi:MAG TPA: acyl-CoA dehydrogenase family protein [Gordonia sp. (in: high G+C Gram-positive bacteria)]|uniref:acyl-CoA dehydrogenase family protein n=2 Tax=Gordonia TaxID=2053 RepID=UPI000FA46D2C|nr:MULTISPECIES: acyl-CoA dehydrogenase family protein [unclassified Gordonia (in: high G+C Gram-positive bacteria)]RUP41170.1 MAG: acyl-CoA dehydrogenase [Gordonia sp. (in: high G+C Gram-positive bacteria)]HNP55641.1 acyl-CoA dehydrogenase family protein [Gordonia sp. (in: high G+C Gram-positive bacteria)]HRC50765.1 acyl-CoA dehydrogenase family protein [Gordonia sp. (in: high G+C Gram-positive bacteria)]